MNPRNVWPSELNTNDFVPTGTAHCRVESAAHIAESLNSSTSKREMKKQALATRGLFICLVMSISKTATVTLPRTSSTVLFERLHFFSSVEGTQEDASHEGGRAYRGLHQNRYCWWASDKISSSSSLAQSAVPS